jgi:hypothetical protein
MRRELSATFFVSMAVLICSFLLRAQTRPPAYNGPVFEDVSRQSGLTVPHLSSPDKRYVLESMSGWVGLFDCDNDGRLDVMTVNGSTVDRYRDGGDPADHAVPPGAGWYFQRHHQIGGPDAARLGNGRSRR